MQYTNLQTILIGKEGVNKAHIIKALKDHKTIRIKFLTKEFTTTNLPGVIVKTIGRTVILKEK